MFADSLEAIATTLTAAGLNASVDPAEVTPPGVVVRAAAILPASAKLCGDYPMRVALWLVVPSTNPLAAYRLLEDLNGRLAAALAGTATTLTADERTFERLVMPDDPTPLPALKVTALTRVPSPTLTPTR
jgi:hypothetical protein